MLYVSDASIDMDGREGVRNAHTGRSRIKSDRAALMKVVEPHLPVLSTNTFILDTQLSRRHLFRPTHYWRARSASQASLSSAYSYMASTISSSRRRLLFSERIKRLEWVMQIRAVSNIYSRAYQQESFHPDQMGQLALRSCLRQAYQQNRGGKCVRVDGSMTALGEPNVVLQ